VEPPDAGDPEGAPQRSKLRDHDPEGDGLARVAGVEAGEERSAADPEGEEADARPQRGAARPGVLKMGSWSRGRAAVVAGRVRRRRSRRDDLRASARVAFVNA